MDKALLILLLSCFSWCLKGQCLDEKESDNYKEIFQKSRNIRFYLKHEKKCSSKEIRKALRGKKDTIVLVLYQLTDTVTICAGDSIILHEAPKISSLDITNATTVIFKKKEKKKKVTIKYLDQYVAFDLKNCGFSRIDIFTTDNERDSWVIFYEKHRIEYFTIYKKRKWKW
jgi:hypothetical protein